MTVLTKLTGGKICTHCLNFQETLSMKVIDLDFRTCIDALWYKPVMFFQSICQSIF